MDVSKVGFESEEIVNSCLNSKSCNIVYNGGVLFIPYGSYRLTYYSSTGDRAILKIMDKTICKFLHELQFLLKKSFPLNDFIIEDELTISSFGVSTELLPLIQITSIYTCGRRAFIRYKTTKMKIFFRYYKILTHYGLIPDICSEIFHILLQLNNTTKLTTIV